MASKRLFDQALEPVRNMRPGSASHIHYGGSRIWKQRFEYSADSTAALVEFSPQHTPTPQEFYDDLRQVPGVHKVKWQTTKSSQNNPGPHYCEQNILVYSSLAQSAALEFELARNQHVENKTVPFTVSACFKPPPFDLIAEAWRILRVVSAGKELFPDHVEAYHRKSLRKLMAAADPDVGPSSASPQPLVEPDASATLEHRMVRMILVLPKLKRSQ